MKKLTAEEFLDWMYKNGHPFGEGKVDVVNMMHQFAAQEVAEALQFAEWTGYYYIRMEGVWCHKYLTQNQRNCITTDKLFEFWRSTISKRTTPTHS